MIRMIGLGFNLIAGLVPACIVVATSAKLAMVARRLFFGIMANVPDAAMLATGQNR
jgi:hypothetical protein